MSNPSDQSPAAFDTAIELLRSIAAKQLFTPRVIEQRLRTFDRELGHDPSPLQLLDKLAIVEAGASVLQALAHLHGTPVKPSTRLEYESWRHPGPDTWEELSQEAVNLMCAPLSDENSIPAKYGTECSYESYIQDCEDLYARVLRYIAGMGAAAVPALVSLIKSESKGSRLQYGAIHVLEMLAENARDAVPHLVTLISENGRSTHSGVCAAEALRAIKGALVERRIPAKSTSEVGAGGTMQIEESQHAISPSAIPALTSSGRDKISFKCPTCGHKIVLDIKHAGKSGKCTRCKTAMRVPQPG